MISYLGKVSIYLWIAGKYVAFCKPKFTTLPTSFLARLLDISMFGDALCLLGKHSGQSPTTDAWLSLVQYFSGFSDSKQHIKSFSKAHWLLSEFPFELQECNGASTWPGCGEIGVLFLPHWYIYICFSVFSGNI